MPTKSMIALSRPRYCRLTARPGPDPDRPDFSCHPGIRKARLTQFVWSRGGIESPLEGEGSHRLSWIRINRSSSYTRIFDGQVVILTSSKEGHLATNGMVKVCLHYSIYIPKLRSNKNKLLGIFCVSNIIRH